ncbi:hypothetical protein [Eikenella sp. Marseille-P7795]|nr:hypothetical protein [Eikenella sp. Marseille-P7795]
MEKWIAEAYEIFAPYGVRFPLNICTCNSCSPEDFQRELLRYPLRDVPTDMLQAYLGSVPLEDEAATALDMKHFLPRILQALVDGEDVRPLDETLLDKLRCDLPECWTDKEIHWLKRFAAAWFAAQLTAPRYEGCLVAWLNMFQFARLDVIDELLALWTEQTDKTGAVREFVGLYSEIPYGGSEPDWYKVCYLPEHCPDREQFAD